MFCPGAEGSLPTGACFFGVPHWAEVKATHFKEFLNLGKSLGNPIKFNHMLLVFGVTHVGILIHSINAGSFILLFLFAVFLLCFHVFTA